MLNALVKFSGLEQLRSMPERKYSLTNSKQTNCILRDYRYFIRAMHDMSLEAKKKGFALVDSGVHIQQAADMLKKKLSGTLKMKPGRHPNKDYLEK